MGIQNLVVNPKSEPIMSNSKKYQFLFEYISSKVILAQRKFFLKTLAEYNCSGPLAFKCQKCRVE